MDDSEVKSNGVGILAWGASTVNLHGGNTISKNGNGINLKDSSYLTSVYDTDLIFSNYGSGITAYRNSSIRLVNDRVYDNQGDGVALHTNSTGRFNPTVSIENNEGYGVNCVSGMATEIWAYFNGNDSGPHNCY